MKNNDKFFEVIAKQYMEKEGEGLKKLSEKLNHEAMDTSNLDKKIENSIKKDKNKKYYMASVLAASIIFIILITNIYYMNQRNFNGNEIAMMTNKLPTGFKITAIDHDKEKTIFYCVGNENNNIVIEEESSHNKLNTEGLKEFYLLNVKVYGISKADYSLITFKFKDKVYTLTSPYDAYDLIAIGESIIKIS